MLKNEQTGMLTWTENGKVIRRRFWGIAIYFPNGSMSEPVNFTGEIVLLTGETPRILKVFRSFQSMRKRKAPWQEIVERLSWCAFTAGLMQIAH